VREDGYYSSSLEWLVRISDMYQHFWVIVLEKPRYGLS
jgi:hypothetical protein